MPDILRGLSRRHTPLLLLLADQLIGDAFSDGDEFKRFLGFLDLEQQICGQGVDRHNVVQVSLLSLIQLRYDGLSRVYGFKASLEFLFASEDHR